MAVAYNRGCPKERTAHMRTLRGGSNYSTTPWFFRKLCCTFSVLVSHIWGIKMNILQKLFQGKCTVSYTHLDVYKRQGYSLFELLPCNSCTVFIIDAELGIVAEPLLYGENV